MQPTFLAVLLLGGCSIQIDVAPRNCPQRLAWYPDPDGDGVGDPQQVFIGCAAPAGWVTALPMDSGTPPPPDSAWPTADTATDTDEPADTGPPADTATGGSGTP